MKKVLFASFFAASAIFGFSSCNGDYDATPTANTGTPNPLNQNNGGGGGGGTAGGTISFKLNGTSYSFSGATYIDAIGRQITGGAQDNGTVRSINLFLQSYSGAKTYALGTGGTGASALYSEGPVGSSSGTTSWSTTVSGGSGSVIVTSDADNKMVGTFDFVANIQNGSGTPAQIAVTNGAFNVPKQ